MNDHEHDARALVVFKTYARFPHPHLDDVVTMCVQCFAQLGVVADPIANDVQSPCAQNASWSADRFPWHPDAEPGDPYYRPSPLLAPSLEEIHAVVRAESRHVEAD